MFTFVTVVQETPFVVSQAFRFRNHTMIALVP